MPAVKKKKAAKRKTAPKKKKAPQKKKWSARVTKHSNALDLEKNVFAANDPKKIANSLKRSANRSKRKKGTPFQSAMSMLNFYENRGGRNLSATKKKVLERAKTELRKLFHKDKTK
jgi:hypothetical protein